MLSAVFTCILILFIWNLQQCLLQDLKPNLILRPKDTSYLSIFIGHRKNDTEVLDVQEIKIVGKKIIIGSRNAVFIVPLQSFAKGTENVLYQQVILWKPRYPAPCAGQGYFFEYCQNFIRVISFVEPNYILLCGTNAGIPECRKHRWSRFQLSLSYLPINIFENFLVPFSYSNSLAYLYSDQFIFTATEVTFIREEGLIRVPLLEKGSDIDMLPLPVLFTQSTVTWFKNPVFIAMFENEDKVFLFFKEDSTYVAKKIVVSKVAQVCKQDVGGKENILRGRWTSFFKARLNCSSSGDGLLYYDEIQHIYGPVDFDGNPTIFATFTTPEKFFRGSAVCAFSVDAIKTAMTGRFVDPSSSGSMKIPAVDPPSSSITECKEKVVRDLDELVYINKHRQLFDAVPSVDDKALFESIRSRVRFTSIAVETVQVDGKDVSVLYIGTQKGSLLKITINQWKKGINKNKFQRKVVFSEEWQVYQPDKCAKNISTVSSSSQSFEEWKFVRNITLLSDFVLVSFKRCIVSVPKKACDRYTCKKACIQSGNPYCAWKDTECVPAIDNERIQLDLFGENTYVDFCPGDQKGSFVLTFVIGILISGTIASIISGLYFLYKNRTTHRDSHFRRSTTTTTEEDQNAPVHDDSATSDQLPNYPYNPLPKKIVEYPYVAHGDGDEDFDFYFDANLNDQFILNKQFKQ